MADPIPLSPTSIVEAGLGAVQTGIGIVQGIGAKRRQKNLLNQRKAFQTPQEILDILSATENNASQGYDSNTLNYLNNQTDQAFSSSVNAAETLGADPNDLSAIFNQKINAIMKIGADNHTLQMQNFSQYISALDTVGANKAAEQKSQQDIIKDKLQAEGLDLQTSAANISGGLNTITGTLAASEIGNLYNPDGTLKVKRQRSGLNNSTTYDTTRIPLMT